MTRRTPSEHHPRAPFLVAGFALALVATTLAATPPARALDTSGVETVRLSSLPACPESVERVEPTGATRVTSTVMSQHEMVESVTAGLVEEWGEGASGAELAAIEMVAANAVSSAYTRYRQQHGISNGSVAVETLNLTEFTELITGELVAMNALPSSALPSSALPSSALPSSALPSSALPSSLTIQAVQAGVEGAVIQSVATALPSSGIPSNQVELFTQQLIGHVASALPSSAVARAEVIVSRVVAAHLENGALPSSAMPAMMAALQVELNALPSSALPSSFAMEAVNAAQALPSSLSFNFAEQIGALPSSALPSSALPSSALPSSIIVVDAISETLGRGYFGRADALPSSLTWSSLMMEMGTGLSRALPSSALPSNAIPWEALPSNALPSNALPSSALPSNALPSSFYARAFYQSVFNLSARNAIPSNAIPSNAIPSNAIPSNAIPSNAIGDDLVDPLAAEMRAVLAGWGVEASALPSNAVISDLLYGAAFRALPSNVTLHEALPANVTPEVISLQISASVAQRGMGIDQAAILEALPSSMTELVIEPVTVVTDLSGFSPATAFQGSALGNMVTFGNLTEFSAIGATDFELGGFGVFAFEADMPVAASTPSEPCLILNRYLGGAGTSVSITVRAMPGAPDPWKVIEGDFSELDWWRSQGWTVEVNDCGYTMTHPDAAPYEAQVRVPDGTVDGFVAGLDSPARLRVMRCSGWNVETTEHSYSYYDPSTGRRGGGVFVPSDWPAGTTIRVPVLVGKSGSLTFLPSQHTVPEVPRATTFLNSFQIDPCHIEGDLFRVPDVFRMSQAEAVDAITACQLTPVFVPIYVDPTSELIGVVAEQEPAAGTSQVAGLPVYYKIAFPEGETTTTTTASSTTTSSATTAPTTTTSASTITLKNYFGWDCANARADAIGLGLSVPLGCEFSWYAPLGGGAWTVDSQEPAAGTQLSPGSQVRLFQLEPPEDQSTCESMSWHWRDGGCYSTP